MDTEVLVSRVGAGESALEPSVGNQQHRKTSTYGRSALAHRLAGCRRPPPLPPLLLTTWCRGGEGWRGGGPRVQGWGIIATKPPVEVTSPGSGVGNAAGPDLAPPAARHRVGLHSFGHHCRAVVGSDQPRPAGRLEPRNATRLPTPVLALMLLPAARCAQAHNVLIGLSTALIIVIALYGAWVWALFCSRPEKEGVDEDGIPTSTFRGRWERQLGHAE